MRSPHGIGGSVVSTPDARVAELVDRSTAPAMCLAALLCDDHPAEHVAVTIVEPDLSTHDLTFGELRARSQRRAELAVD
jgi:acetyl-CoA synthetase